jgi:hypothetical protein
MNTLSRSKISTEESATSPWTCRVTTTIHLQNDTHMCSPEGLAHKWWWYSTDTHTLHQHLELEMSDPFKNYHMNINLLSWELSPHMRHYYMPTD